MTASWKGIAAHVLHEGRVSLEDGIAHIPYFNEAGELHNTRLVGLTFARWRRATWFLPGAARRWLHERLPERLQRQAWDDLDRRLNDERRINVLASDEANLLPVTEQSARFKARQAAAIEAMRR